MPAVEKGQRPAWIIVFCFDGDEKAVYGKKISYFDRQQKWIARLAAIERER